MSSISGSESSPLGSGLGAAAPLSVRGKIMSLRVTRNPRMKMHWSSGKSYSELKGPNSEFRTRWLGVVAAPPRFCYQHAITEPPAIQHHPLWKEATSLTKKVAGQRRKPKYTRRTTSTALQLAVDHAFTGSYARRFRPADPPESHLCVCSPVLRDPLHLLTKCPLFHQQRVEAVIITDHRTLSLRQLFQTHPDRLLAFLQAPGIARPPPNTSQREWVEEEADTGIG